MRNPELRPDGGIGTGAHGEGVGGGGGYRAAVERFGVADRSDRRVRIRVGGRSPGPMLNGILTNRLPGDSTEVEPGIWKGEGQYAALLTPKGRMVTDLRILPAHSPEGESFVLDLPAAGVTGTLELFSRVLPPRLARAERVLDDALLTLLGPEAPAWMAREVFGLRVDEGALSSLPEGAFLRMGSGPGSVLVVRNGDMATDAWDLHADGETVAAHLRRAREAGAEVVGAAALETLRVEAGRPEYGVDIDATTIPTEAGLDRRAVDHGKGCYTGQEVIVRIRDRGHVNRHLRGLVFGEGVTVVPGSPLLRPDDGKEVGRVTSVVDSPRAGGWIGLGWVRREIEPMGEVRAGEGGAGVSVRALPEEERTEVNPSRWAF